ncbi:CPBP family glutamic-type intramembrane protease [Zobellia laminariae]|uniref:CPBP family glutamic-type intramembrane protease n=1 Tax=Zobellia laminariae TaxID=248906 RepID=UPI004056BDAF
MRLPLKFSNTNISIASAVFIFYSLYYMKFHAFIAVCFAMIFGLMVYMVFKKNPFLSEFLSSFYKNKFKIIFYGFSLIFGLVHLRNYEISYSNIFWVSIIIAPFFLSALIYGYIRMRYSIKESIIMHSLYNLILFMSTKI